MDFAALALVYLRAFDRLDGAGALAHVRQEIWRFDQLSASWLGVIIGGTAFGMGWAITGACPGPIYAQIGSGEYLAIITLAAAVVGMYLYAFLQPKLPH